MLSGAAAVLALVLGQFTFCLSSEQAQRYLGFGFRGKWGNTSFYLSRTVAHGPDEKALNCLQGDCFVAQQKLICPYAPELSCS